MRSYHLIYQSQALTAFTQWELVELLQKSWAFNLDHCLTGVLLHAPNGHFLQVLEGEKAAVHRLYYDRIAPNPRHQHLEVLGEGPCATQVFSDWCMSFRTGPDQPNLPGYFAPPALSLRLNTLARATPELKRLLLDFTLTLSNDNNVLSESIISG